MRYHFLTRVEEKIMANAGNITQDDSLRRLDRLGYWHYNFGRQAIV